MLVDAVHCYHVPLLLLSRTQLSLHADAAATRIVTFMRYQQRNNLAEHNKGLTLTFSDGSTQTVELLSNTELQSFDLSAVQTSSVRIDVTSVFTAINNGAVRIVFYGYEGEAHRKIRNSHTIHTNTHTPHTSSHMTHTNQ